MISNKVKFSTLLLLCIALPVSFITIGINYYWVSYVKKQEYLSFRHKCWAIVNEYTNQLLGPMIISDYPSIIYNVRNSPKNDLVLAVDIKDLSGRRIADWGTYQPKDLETDSGEQESAGTLTLVKPILVNNKAIATLTIVFSKMKYILAINSYRNWGWMFTFIATCVVAFISYLIAIFVTRPLKSLTNKVNEFKIERTDREIFIRETIVEEPCVLLMAFNKLINRSRSYQILSEQNAQLAAIGRISSYIGHDMRSPLSVLKSYVSTDMSPADSDMQEYKHAAVRSVDKLLQMADSLVDYAKATKIERAPVDIGNFLRDSVVGEMQIRANEKGVSITCNSDSGVVVDIDVFKMGRVLVNMINNSIQAISHEYGRILINAFMTHHDLTITIADNGKGIEAEHLARVFDNFYTMSKRGGIGLGLSYCKQVVEAHGGTIEVQSEVGKGTTFTIRIPNCVVIASEMSSPGDVNTLSFGGKRFILADDDDGVRGNLRRIIEENGGEVVWETDCPEKVLNGKELDITSVDAALVDYKFEGSDISGIDIIKHLKSKGLSEIHLCTGFADDQEIRADAFAAGATSVIGKQLF